MNISPRRFWVLILFLSVCIALITGVQPPGIQAQSSTPTATPITTPALPVPLKTLYAYDMGISFEVPATWDAPIFSAGQLTVSPPVPNVTDPIAKPTIALRLIDPRRELGLPKEATLQDIARVAIAGTGITETAVDIGAVAGLEAGYVETEADITIGAVKYQLFGTTHAVRLLDGRVALFASTAPRTFYPEFGFTQATILTSTRLIDPAMYPDPGKLTINSGILVSASDQLGYTLPADWVTQTDGSGGFYHAQADAAYQDDSGFANGLSLTVIAITTDTTGTQPVTAVPTDPAVALRALIGLSADAQIESLTLNGIQALRYVQPDADARTGQLISFYGVPAPDGTLVAFRWARPAMLEWRTDPTIEAIMNTLAWSKFTPQSTPQLTPQPTPTGVASQTASAP